MLRLDLSGEQGHFGSAFSLSLTAFDLRCPVLTSMMLLPGVFDTKQAAWELAERRVAPPHSSSTFSMQCPGLTDSVPIAVERSLSFRRKATRRAQDVQRNGGGEGEEEGSYLYLTAWYAASKRATRCLILTCLAVACEPPERKEDGWYWWRSNVHGNRWRVQEHLVG